MLDIDPLRDGPTPLPAATVILLRDGASGMETYLVQRHRKLRFMGGATVFPGGKLDPADAAPALLAQVAGLTALEAAQRLGEDEPTQSLALHVAAIRETFEEAGVLLGEGASDLDGMRTALASEGLCKLVVDRGVRLRADRLAPLSRWVTPAVEKRRFDARFFLAEVAPGTAAAHDTEETIAGAWLTPSVAIERHVAADIDLPPPTLRTLELLAPFERAADAIAAALRTPPPVVRPVFRDLAGQWVLALPGDPEHPEPTPVLGGPTRFTAHDARWFSG
jgi:8-oxo-dGTP pyrophosphatase MutT (NUDIX family)